MQSISQPSAKPPLSARIRLHAPIFLVGLGHGSTHWQLGTFLILLPFVAKDLGLSYTEAGVLVTVLHIASFFANFAGGMAVDISGRRVGFLVACLLVGGAALMGFGLSTHYLALVLMVALISCSNGFWHSPAISFISLSFPKRRGYGLSIHSTGASLGDMVAPGVTGLLLTWLTWHQAAMISALPAFLFAVLIFLLVLPKETAGLQGGNSGISAGQWYRSIKQMLRSRSILSLCLMVAFRGMGQTGLGMFLPLYLADGLRVSPMMVGVTILAMHLGAVVMSPIAGMLSDRVGRRPVVAVGLAATTVLIISLTLFKGLVPFVGAVVLLGFALYAIRPVMQSWMMDMSPAAMSGTASSIFFSIQSAFSALMPLMGGMVADRYGLFEVFYLIAAVMLIANLMLLAIPRTAR
ncbi:MAG: MFS transporter [SAR324 cluster bacterium]|nr:MFS transporter [SAR324 cluster bacterium]